MYNGSKPSWYAFVFQADSNLEDSLIEKIYEALKAEGLVEVDRPFSTSPLNLLPLFQNPTELFAIYKKHPFCYKQGDFPKAEKFFSNALKLPVWSHKEDKKIMQLYIDGIRKVLDNYHNLI